VLKQAKGVRLLEEQRAYMRQYREDKRNDSKVSGSLCVCDPVCNSSLQAPLRQMSK